MWRSRTLFHRFFFLFRRFFFQTVFFLFVSFCPPSLLFWGHAQGTKILGTRHVHLGRQKRGRSSTPWPTGSLSMPLLSCSSPLPTPPCCRPSHCYARNSRTPSRPFPSIQVETCRCLLRDFLPRVFLKNISNQRPRCAPPPRARARRPP